MLISKYFDLNISKVFKAISDDMRLRILRLLFHGSFHVNEIQFILNAKQSNISHHLKILQESSIIKNKKEGSLIYYRLNDLNKSSFYNQIIELINSNSELIPQYIEDSKRLDTILNKRKKNAEDFFNSIGKNFDNLQEELFNNIYSVNEVLSLFEHKMSSLLDLGCGTGRNLPELAKYSDKVIGVDSSPAMLQLSEHICKSKNLNYELKLGDISKLPFDQQSIDGIFINMVLHHLSNPEDVIKEASRIIKNNGKLLLIELLNHNDESMREKYADLWLGFTIDELSDWIKTSGFSIKNQLVKSNSGSLKVIIILAVKNSM